MSAYATRTQDGQRLRLVFQSDDGWCALLTGPDTAAARAIAARAIAAEAQKSAPAPEDLATVAPDRFPGEVLYLLTDDHDQDAPTSQEAQQ